MISDESLKYANDEELEKVWMDGYQKWMNDARASSDPNVEFQKQQQLYTKFAGLYDNALRIEQFSGPVRIADQIESLYGKNKSIKILDFGCGTGLVAENLVKFGFCDIDGVDCNQAMLDLAEEKGNMSKYLLSRDGEGLKDIPSGTYDVVCSSGVFFLSSTHPGFDCLEELARLVKKGGKIVILTKKDYLSQSYVKFEIVEELEKRKVLKAQPIETFEGYRKAFEFEEDNKSTGAILMYEVL